MLLNRERSNADASVQVISCLIFIGRGESCPAEHVLNINIFLSGNMQNLGGCIETVCIIEVACSIPVSRFAPIFERFFSNDQVPRCLHAVNNAESSAVF